MRMLIVACLVACPALSLATTGGAETVSMLSWDKAGQRVWFVKATAAGYGLQVGHLDARTGKRVVVHTGDIEDDDPVRAAALERTLSKIENKHAALRAVDLRRLGVTARVRARTPETKGAQINDPGLYQETLMGVSLPWAVEVAVKGAPLTTLQVAACDFARRGIVAGYGRPDQDFLVLVVATTNVCFEGGYRVDELVLLPRAGVKAAQLLKAAANDTPPEQISGTPPAGALGLELDRAQLATSLNTIGFRAYRAGRLRAAQSYFHRAVAAQIGEPLQDGMSRLTYPLALFNLAATTAKLQEKADALDYLELLLSSEQRRAKYLKRVRADKDFAGLREEARYQALVAR